MKPLSRLGFGDYPFSWTKNMFGSRNHETFCDYVYPEWTGKPITYLEIGVFEGMSMAWMLMHVLTHSDSRAVGIDPWLMIPEIDSDGMEAVMMRAHWNTSHWQDRCSLVQGNSDMVLRKMGKGDGFKGISKGSLDLCMIDGSHSELLCLNDARMVLPLMRPGGWILFDDVEMHDNEKRLRVKKAVRQFAEESKDTVESLWNHKHMACYRKM